jgi:hypothetical protein
MKPMQSRVRIDQRRVSEIEAGAVGVMGAEVVDATSLKHYQNVELDRYDLKGIETHDFHLSGPAVGCS